MSDIALAEFQSAAVETICNRLTDRGGSRRFLLADEVGLGKTVVARGVIDDLLRRRRGKLGVRCSPRSTVSRRPAGASLAG